MMMLAEYGTLSLADVLAPAIADGRRLPDRGAARRTPSSGRRAGSRSGRTRRRSSCRTRARRARRRAPGEIFRQPDLAATLRKLVEAEQQALAAGKSRKEAIYAAYDRFYKGDIAAGVRARLAGAGRAHHDGGPRQLEGARRGAGQDDYKGIDVYKLDVWTQGPAMLQALNILENVDLKAMGYNSARYIHTLYQAMNLAFADRDFYYGDPYFPPEEPSRAALEGVRARARRRDRLGRRTIPIVKPGDPYPFQGGTNPFLPICSKRLADAPDARSGRRRSARRTLIRRRRSTPARRRSRPRTRRAGSSRSRRAAAGCRRASRAGPASA